MYYCYLHKHYTSKQEIHTEASAFNFVRQTQECISTAQLCSGYNPKYNKHRRYLYIVNKT